MFPIDDYRLGSNNEKLVFGSSEEVRAIALAMARQCRRSLDIAARHLEPAIYETMEFLDAVRELALQSRHSRIRLLVMLPEALHRRGHKLLDLAASLPTFVKVHVPGEEHKDFNESILIADEIGYLHRLQADRYEGTADFCDPPYVGGLVRRFDDVWDKGEPDPNFRRLSI